MKNKIISLALIFLSFSLLSIGLFIQLNTKEKNSNNNLKTETKKERIVEFSNHQSELNDDKMKELYLKLDNWGRQIYEKKEYLSFSKKNNMYFISLKELSEKYNYDISIFKDKKGTDCDLDVSGIYFDIDNIRKLNMEIPLLSTLIDCGIDKKEHKFLD